ncbi:MAG TPA: sigma-70 family RNA polymerase sigma factor [Pyrinomonadaceae bacterium]|nr:sigma-70 family RNA polymerase sigma factor [Pyrinomonadaceae bacterium]
MAEATPQPDKVSEMLKAWSAGDREIAEEFMPLVYDELRRQARRFLRKERPNHTLASTALVHEAYIRLVDQHDVTWQNRAHFFGVASEMMRRILVNHAIHVKRQKRGGEIQWVTLDAGIPAMDPAENVDLVCLDEALTRLETLDQRQARVVELRYFGGLDIEETAEVLEISPATVKREWNMARAWLRAELAPPNE